MRHVTYWYNYVLVHSTPQILGSKPRHRSLCRVLHNFTKLKVFQYRSLSLLFYLLNAGPFIPFQPPRVKVKRATRREASVHWWHPHSEYPIYWMIMLTKPSDVTKMTKACFFFVEGRTKQLYLPLTLTDGSQYRVSVAAVVHVFLDTGVPSFLVFDEGTMSFRAGTSRSCLNKSYKVILQRSVYTYHYHYYMQCCWHCPMLRTSTSEKYHSTNSSSFMIIGDSRRR